MYNNHVESLGEDGNCNKIIQESLVILQLSTIILKKCNVNKIWKFISKVDQIRILQKNKWSQRGFGHKIIQWILSKDTSKDPSSVLTSGPSGITYTFPSMVPSTLPSVDTILCLLQSQLLKHQ